MIDTKGFNGRIERNCSKGDHTHLHGVCQGLLSKMWRIRKKAKLMVETEGINGRKNRSMVETAEVDGQIEREFHKGG